MLLCRIVKTVGGFLLSLIHGSLLQFLRWFVCIKAFSIHHQADTVYSAGTFCHIANKGTLFPDRKSGYVMDTPFFELQYSVYEYSVYSSSILVRSGSYRTYVVRACFVSTPDWLSFFLNPLPFWCPPVNKRTRRKSEAAVS